MSFYKGVLNNFQKVVFLEQFLELNDLKLEINLPYFSKSVINNEIPIIQDLLYHYNEQLNEFSTKIDKYY